MDEKTLLSGFLQSQRDAIIAKAEGLTDEQARERLVPSLTTVVGIVYHLAGVERWWFRVQMEGERDVPLTWTRDDLDADFKAEGVTLADAIAEYRLAARESDIVIARHELADISAREARHVGEHVTLRWIVLHMIEETARHAGHTDILREQLDAGV